MSLRLLAIAAIATFLSSLALPQSKGVAVQGREAAPAQERRIALVVGNATYESSLLASPDGNGVQARVYKG